MSHGRAREAADDGKVRVGRPPRCGELPRYEAAAGDAEAARLRRRRRPLNPPWTLRRRGGGGDLGS
jgi:hypothetical protein